MEKVEESYNNNGNILYKKKHRFRCGVHSCGVTSASHPHLSFFTVPLNLERRAKWLRMLKYNVDLDRCKVHICERHFDKKYISGNSKRRRLLKAAVPTLFLSKDTTTLSMNSGNDSLDSGDIADSDKKRNLSELFQNDEPTKMVKIKEEKDCLTVFVDEDNQDDYSEEGFTDNKSDYFSPYTNFSKGKRKSRKQKYNLEFKMFALSLYFKSPNAYRLLQTTFSLPRISTLYRLCLPKATEVSQDVLKAWSIKIDGMTPAEKQSVVCIGTMTLSPNIEYDAENDRIFGLHELGGPQAFEAARHGLLVIVRGLFHKWKQAVSILFLNNFQNSEDVNTFIDEIIKKLLDIGLNVRGLLCNLEPGLVTAANKRGISAASPFFFVGTKKIYFMYDTLHLMRSMRDTYLICNFEFFDNKVAKWQDIEDYYEYDKNNSLRLAPKLTENHIKPNVHSVNNIRFTVELFSTATATAVSTCIDLQISSSPAQHTVEWILMMSKLMDMLNFSTKYPSEDKNVVFSGEQTQVNFLEQMVSLFTNLRLSPVEPKVEFGLDLKKYYAVFKEGFTITINSILSLFGTLQEEHCCLPIVGLSHDCLNDCFDRVHQKHTFGPTAKQMAMCLKFPVCNIFQYSCKRRLPGELEMFLSQARQMPDIEMYEEEHTKPYVDQCADECAEFPTVSLPSENKVEYLSLYLLYKGYEKHCSCDAMKDYVCGKDIMVDNSSNVPLDGHRTCETERNLVSREFVQFVEVLEVKFKEYFTENRFTCTIEGLENFTRNISFQLPCQCFPLRFIKQLYFRYRLFLVLNHSHVVYDRGNYNSVFVVNDL